MRVDDFADAVAQAGVAIASVGAFVAVLALVSRPWLGRQVTQEPIRELISINPYEATFVFLWRQLRWARWLFVAGCVLAILGVAVGA